MRRAFALPLLASSNPAQPGRRVRATPAPEPSDILWSNLFAHGIRGRLRNASSLAIMLMVLLVSFSVQLLVATVNLLPDESRDGTVGRGGSRSIRLFRRYRAPVAEAIIIAATNQVVEAAAQYTAAHMECWYTRT